MSKRKIIGSLALLALIAVGLRIAAIVVLHAWTRPNPMEHWFIAHALYGYHDFSFSDFGYVGPTGVQSPVYPTILYLAYRVFGLDSPMAYAATMIFNSLVGGLVVILTYALARTLGARVRVALVAAALCAIWPSQIYAVTVSQAIVLIIAGQAAMIVFFYRGVRSGKLSDWIIFSVVACFSALTEPALLPIAAFSGLLVLNWRSLMPAIRVRNAAVLLLAAMLIIMPWTIRNRVMLGRWVPIKSQFWSNVWKGTNEYATGSDRMPIPSQRRKELIHHIFSMRDSAMQNTASGLRHRDFLTIRQLLRVWGKPEMQREDVFKQWAVQWIEKNPTRYLQLCLVRFTKTIFVDWDNPNSYHAIYLLPRIVLLIGSVGGLILAIRRRWALAYPLLLIGSCILLYTFTLTASRFSIPFEPFQLCLVAELIAGGTFLSHHADASHVSVHQPEVHTSITS